MYEGVINLKYSKFIINNYRAIDYTEVPISNSLIPIIGINESGKTSILKAILAFDKLKDKYNYGEHLNYKNNYLIKEHDCIIKAEIIIESEDDIEYISKKMKKTMGDELLTNLQHLYKNGEPLLLCRSLSTKKYFVEEINVQEDQNERLANTLHELLPFILYFDDFSDRVPEVIKFPKKYLENGTIRGRNSNAEWQGIIEEIFNRSSNEISLKDFLEMTNVKNKTGLLYDVQDTLNEQIVEQWKDLKKKGRTSLADDEGELELLLNFTEDEEYFNFEFNIVDKSANNKKRTFNIVERSKGFQWFFNFILKLKFNSKYRDDYSNAIYLLDEPGSYLHSSAQEELLKELKDISKTNTVIYCTHSQHLLDPEVINISSIRIAEKINGLIFLKDFNSLGNSNSQGALTPLYTALHLRTGLQNQNLGKVVITEGITDYYLFRMLVKYTTHIKVNKLQFIPGAGAQHLKDIISMAIAWSDNYLVLLDSDTEGRNAFKKYKKYFGEKEALRFFKYEKPNKKDNVVLEEFFSEDDAKKLLEITGIDNLKSAIIFLYFTEDETIRRRFIKKLSVETINNMSIVFIKLNEL